MRRREKLICSEGTVLKELIQLGQLATGGAADCGGERQLSMDGTSRVTEDYYAWFDFQGQEIRIDCQVDDDWTDPHIRRSGLRHRMRYERSTSRTEPAGVPFEPLQ
jgi:hypothetical protein